MLIMNLRGPVSIPIRRIKPLMILCMSRIALLKYTPFISSYGCQFRLALGYISRNGSPAHPHPRPSQLSQETSPDYSTSNRTNDQTLLGIIFLVTYRRTDVNNSVRQPSPSVSYLTICANAGQVSSGGRVRSMATIYRSKGRNLSMFLLQ